MADQSDAWDRNGTEADEPEPSVYEDVSTVEWVAILVLCSPFYLFFADVQDQPFRGFVAALSAAVIMALIWMLRPLRAKMTFWATLAAITVAHVALIYFLPYTGEFRFGFALFPVVLADAYLCARLIIFACGARLQD